MNYLFTGQESCLKEEALLKLKSKYFSSDFSIQSNFHVYYAGVEDIRDIISCAYTIPFAAQSRIILIKETENFSSDEKEILFKYLARPSKHSIFVFDSEKEIDKDPFFRKLEKYAKKIIFDKPRGYKLEAWIKDEVRRFNKNISIDALTFIKMLADSKNLSELRKEINKVNLFVGNKKEISKSDIEEIFCAYVNEDIFKLIDAIKTKNVTWALNIVSNLTLRRVRPQEIIGLLAWRLRNAVVHAEGRDTASVQQLRRSTEKLLFADIAVKESRIDKKLALEFAILELCR